MELTLVRRASETPGLITSREEGILRTALSLARMYRVRHQATDIGVGAFLAPFREDVTSRLRPVLLGKGRPGPDALAKLALELREPTLQTRDALVRRYANRLPPEA